jgi:hypothetical protein
MALGRPQKLLSKESNVGLFGEDGRRVPGQNHRVFSRTPSYYYRLEHQRTDYSAVYDRIKAANLLGSDFGVNDFQRQAEVLLEIIRADADFSGLLNGVHLPFIVDSAANSGDIGANLETRLLPGYQSSFGQRFPEAHFKAVLQSDSKLADRISYAEHSRYGDFASAVSSRPVVGWYFPQALQEFDIQSQRNQMRDLPCPEHFSVCLAGGIDICAALTGTPDLLINQKAYPPILCMSAYEHVDPRMVLIMKSYGPHMEFWCLTQMLTSSVTQVSEQWSGGLTIFC